MGRAKQIKKKGGPGATNAMLYAMKGGKSAAKYTKRQKQPAARSLGKKPSPAAAKAAADAKADARLAKSSKQSETRKPNGNADPQWQKIQHCTAKARKFEGESGPRGNLIPKSWWYRTMRKYLDPGITISDIPEEEYGGETAQDVGRNWCEGIAQNVFSKGIQNVMTQHGNMYDRNGKHTTRVTRTVHSFDCYGPGALDDMGGGNHQDAPVVQKISRQLASENLMTFDMKTQ